MAEPLNINIDPTGDVLLVCGMGEDQKQLQVSSAILRQASPVLEALFLRAIQQPYTSPVAIVAPVPQDGPIAMELLCKILHLQLHDIPETLDKQLLKDVLIVRQKYKIAHPSLKICMSFWLGNHINTLDPISNDTNMLIGILAASVQFHFTDYVTKVGLLLVKTTAGDFPPRTEDMPKVLTHLLGQLEMTRDTIKEDLLESIRAEVARQKNPDTDNFVSCHGDCSHAIKDVEDFISHLEAWSLWPLEHVKFMSLADAWLLLRHDEVDDHQQKKDRDACATYCTNNAAKSAKDACANLRSQGEKAAQVLRIWLVYDPTPDRGIVNGFPVGIWPSRFSQMREVCKGIYYAQKERFIRVKRAEIKKRGRDERTRLYELNDDW